MLNKYYVGAVHIGEAVGAGKNTGIMRETVEEAIVDAKKKILNEGANCVVIVEIIRIVRKDFPPISVEVV
jgi:UDP-3-O-[3-hydroxymyristoyl] glucosamine N-acyltransferase